MLNFKTKLLFAVASLGLVGSANAQITCAAAPAIASKTFRAEGKTEQVGRITVGTCTGSTNTAAVSFTVTTNAPLANVLLTGTTTSATDATAELQTVGNAAVVARVAGTRVNATTLQFAFAPTITTATIDHIVIDNVRVDVSQLVAGTNVTASVASGTGLFVSSTAAVSAGFSAASLAASSFAGYSNLAICATSTSAVYALGVVRVNENFLGALSTAAQEAALEGAGTANTLATNPNGIGAGAVSGAVIGTRIALAFANLPAGVNFYIPVTVTSATGLTLSLVPAATSQDSAVLAGGTIGTTAAAGLNVGPTSGVAQINPVDGAVTAYYAVTAVGGLGSLQSTGSIGTFTGTAYPAIASPTQIVLYATIQTGTNQGVTTAPAVAVYLVGNSGTGYPQFAVPAAPTVRTAANPSGFTGFQGILSGCNTTLVFPYLLNVSGYDTGIALTNAGLGSSVTGSTVSSTTNGSCTLTLWGASSLNGTAITPIVLAAKTVVAGQVNAFTISGELSALTAPPAGYAGYGVASCNFQGAHGFAFITDGFGTTPGRGLSQGYLAPILGGVFNGTAFANTPAL